MRLALLLTLLVLNTPVPGKAVEPFLKKGDVIALIGGEDMVVVGELGYFEFLLTRALPNYKLRFRNLAWEGDTVFEQRRDLNFPPLEVQLDQVGATVILSQFGQAEIIVPGGRGFLEAYDNLLDRLGSKYRNEGRRVVLIFPTPLEYQEMTEDQRNDREGIIANLEQGRRYWGAWFGHAFREQGITGFTRDGIHLNDWGHALLARFVATLIHDPTSGDRNQVVPDLASTRLPLSMTPSEQRLLALICAKNRLWFDYRRVQNWAFLAGDRTNQPSSRDHRDPAKRWFPAEREEFLPLIAAKETEIDTLAAKLNKPRQR